MNYFDRVSNALTGMYRTSQEGNPFKGIDFTTPTDMAGNPATKPANDMYSRARRGWPTMQEISGMPLQHSPVVLGANGVPFSSSQLQNQAALSDATSMFSNLPQVQDQVPLNLNNLWNPESNTAGYQTLTSPNASVTGSAAKPAYQFDLAAANNKVNPLISQGTNAYSPNSLNTSGMDPLGLEKGYTPAIGNVNPPAAANTGNSFSNLFGLTDWMNGGTPQYNTVNGTQVANKNYMSSGDILGGIGGALSTGMGIYGMFTGLDQGQQQLDDTSRRTDLLESKYNEELRHRGAIREQNKAGY